MQRKYSKKSMQLLQLLALLLITNKTGAQLFRAGYMDQLYRIRSVTNNPVLSYRYTVTMHNKEHKAVDSIAGYLCRHYADYKDSSNLGLSLLSGGYFFKGLFKRKEAILYKLATVEQKLGLKREDLNNNLLLVPDSLLSVWGDFAVSERAGLQVLEYRFKSAASGMQQISFYTRQSDKSLQEVRMVFAGPGSDGNTTTYRLFGFSNEPSAAGMNPQRYFTINGTGAKLAPPFHSYKLKALL